MDASNMPPCASPYSPIDGVRRAAAAAAKQQRNA